MDGHVARYIELVRELGLPVRTGTRATPEQLAALEGVAGGALPDLYQAVVGEVGYLCAGNAGELVIYGVAPADHGCPCEVDALRAASSIGHAEVRVPLVRAAAAGAGDGPWILALDVQGQLRVLTDGPTRAGAPVAPAFGDELQRALKTLVAVAEVAAERSEPDDDALAAGQASVQMFAIPREVVAALRKEPAVADEITLYTSLEEFREQTVTWEKTTKRGGSPEPFVQRMRWLLNQRGISKLKHLVTGEVEVPRWPDAIVACFGETAPESLALRGAMKLPCEGTDTIHLLSPGEVKQVADALAGSEERLRAGFQPAVLRARGLYNTDAPNDAAFLEELTALWGSVADGIRDAAAQGCGWLIRRTEG